MNLFLTIIAEVFGIISGGWILIAMDYAYGSGPDSIIINVGINICGFYCSNYIVLFGTLIGLIPADRATNIKPTNIKRE